MTVQWVVFYFKRQLYFLHAFPIFLNYILFLKARQNHYTTHNQHLKLD